jgi:hypothetical protein
LKRFHAMPFNNGMASITSAQLLDQVNQAISDLLSSGVASYGDNGQTFTMNDLDKLERLRAKLQIEVAAGSGGNFRLGVPLRRSR